MQVTPAHIHRLFMTDWKIPKLNSRLQKHGGATILHRCQHLHKIIIPEQTETKARQKKNEKKRSLLEYQPLTICSLKDIFPINISKITLLLALEAKRCRN